MRIQKRYNNPSKITKVLMVKFVACFWFWITTVKMTMQTGNCSIDYYTFTL